MAKHKTSSTMARFATTVVHVPEVMRSEEVSDTDGSNQLKDYADKLAQSVFAELKSHPMAKEIAVVVHDEDVNAIGERVQPHIHVVVRFKSPNRISAVAKWLKAFGVTPDDVQRSSLTANRHTSGRSVSPRFAFPLALAYLTHIDDPNKYQYDDSAVISNFDWKTERAKAAGYLEKVAGARSRVLEKLEAGEISLDEALKTKSPRWIDANAKSLLRWCKPLDVFSITGSVGSELISDESSMPEVRDIVTLQHFTKVNPVPGMLERQYDKLKQQLKGGVENLELEEELRQIKLKMKAASSNQLIDLGALRSELMRLGGTFEDFGVASAVRQLANKLASAAETMLYVETPSDFDKYKKQSALIISTDKDWMTYSDLQSLYKRQYKSHFLPALKTLIFINSHGLSWSVQVALMHLASEPKARRMLTDVRKFFEVELPIVAISLATTTDDLYQANPTSEKTFQAFDELKTDDLKWDAFVDAIGSRDQRVVDRVLALSPLNDVIDWAKSQITARLGISTAPTAFCIALDRNHEGLKYEWFKSSDKATGEVGNVSTDERNQDPFAKLLGIDDIEDGDELYDVSVAPASQIPEEKVHSDPSGAEPSENVPHPETYSGPLLSMLPSEFLSTSEIDCIVRTRRKQLHISGDAKIIKELQGVYNRSQPISDKIDALKKHIKEYAVQATNCNDADEAKSFKLSRLIASDYVNLLEKELQTTELVQDDSQENN